MDLANITLLLGGHQGNTIQKIVTPGEIAVLQLIHGNESVRDVAYYGDIQRSHRAEIERLHNLYGQRQNDGRSVSKAVASLFPGAAARVFEKLEELELDSEFVKNLGPATAKAVAPAEPATPVEGHALPLEKMSKAQILQIASERNIDVSPNDKKDVIIAALQAAPASDPVEGDEQDDGVGEEMPDANMFQ